MSSHQCPTLGHGQAAPRRRFQKGLHLRGGGALRPIGAAVRVQALPGWRPGCRHQQLLP